MFTIILYILVLLTPVCCKKQDMHLLQATSQKFAGGTVMSPVGTAYVFTFVVAAGSEKLKFNHIWLGENYIPEFDVRVNRAGTTSGIFNAGDTIALSFSVYRNLPEEDSTAIQHVLPVPCSYQGAALIEYSRKNKKKYFEVQTIQKQQPQLRP